VASPENNVGSAVLALSSESEMTTEVPMEGLACVVGGVVSRASANVEAGAEKLEWYGYGGNRCAVDFVCEELAT
jgi:hypothetical protein